MSMRRIGGSKVASILDCNPFETKHTAWLYLTNQIDGPEDNPAMQRGRMMEEPIAQTFQTFHDEYIIRESPYTYKNQYIDPEHEFLCALPDREVVYAGEKETAGLLEIKTASSYSREKWCEDGSSNVPINYYCQGQWYMGMFNLPFCYFPVMFFNDSTRRSAYAEFRIEYDDEFYQLAREQCIKFWQEFVEGGKEPEIDTIDQGTQQWIKRRYPANITPEEPATEQEEKTIAEYVEALRVLKEAEANEERLKAALQVLIGERSGIISNEYGKFTWKNNKDGTKTDWKAIVEELAPAEEIIAKFTKETKGARVFRAPRINFN